MSIYAACTLLLCLGMPAVAAVRVTSVCIAQAYTGTLPPPPDQACVMHDVPLNLRGPRPHRPALERWLRVELPAAVAAGPPAAVYLSYVSPNAAVYLNGVHLGASEGFRESASQSWNYPLLVPLPPALLRVDHNELWVEIRDYGGESANLGALWVGPEESLYRRYERSLWLKVLGVEVVSLLVGVIGLFALLLWIRRRGDEIFGLFALSCGIWIVRNTQFFLVHTGLSSLAYEAVTDAALFWLVAVLFTLCFRIAGQRMPLIERAMYGYAAAATIAMSIAGSEYKWIVTAVFYVMIFPGSTIFITYLSRAAWRQGTTLMWLLWLAAVVTTVLGGYDFLLMADLLPWQGAYLMPYSALFFAGTVGWALMDQFILTHRKLERLNTELEARVRARESELASRYQDATELERQQAIRVERERILRDMHDGVGLQLISSIRLIEKMELTQEQMSELLGEAMDELRIAIDSAKPAAQDLLVMLGNLRYRIEPRMNAAGVVLAWDVGGCVGLERLLPHQVMQITRIVQEAFTNVLKHAEATRVSLGVHTTADGAIEIIIADNGRGFDPATPASGEGLANMKNRARKIGGSFEIASSPGATRLRLVVARTPPTTSSSQAGFIGPSKRQQLLPDVDQPAPISAKGWWEKPR